MKCSFCQMPHGTRINFINGGTCRKCGVKNIVPIAVYTHDSVDDDEKYWHHCSFEGVALCHQCGHSAKEAKSLCKELNSESASISKPETAKF